MLSDVVDELEWRHLGYECRIRFHSGFRCGYVRIPYGHPWFCRQKEARDPTAVDIRDEQRAMEDLNVISLMLGEGESWLATIEAQVEVHGGLTFSSCFDKDSGWWIGFDCFHAGDRRSDEVEAEMDKLLGYTSPFRFEGHYWTHEEVKLETEKLAWQVKQANMRAVRRFGSHETEHPDEARMAWEETCRENGEWEARWAERRKEYATA